VGYKVGEPRDGKQLRKGMELYRKSAMTLGVTKLDILSRISQTRSSVCRHLSPESLVDLFPVDVLHAKDIGIIKSFVGQLANIMNDAQWEVFKADVRALKV